MLAHVRHYAGAELAVGVLVAIELVTEGVEEAVTIAGDGGGVEAVGAEEGEFVRVVILHHWSDVFGFELTNT